MTLIKIINLKKSVRNEKMELGDFFNLYLLAFSMKDEKICIFANRSEAKKIFTKFLLPSPILHFLDSPS